MAHWRPAAVAAALVAMAVSWAGCAAAPEGIQPAPRTARASATHVGHASSPRSDTTVTMGKEPMKLSSTGPDYTLPSFFFMAGSEEGGALYGGYNYSGGLGEPDPFHLPVVGCPDDAYENEMPDLRVPQLPWALQNDWGCERTPTEVDVIVAENDFLRAAITPQWGGKVWSLYHKVFKRQLFFNNPAHQPNNIGYRKAWVSGGCEWNWAPGRVGHSVFTESPVYAATIPSERGPITRVWEYDRQNHSVWSVDMLFLDDVMWAHPRIYNTEPAEIPGYWWTCVAMPVTDRTRIVTPAELSMSPCTPWPTGSWTTVNDTFRGPNIGSCASDNGGSGLCAWQQDMSYLGNIPHAHDFFMYVPQNRTPYITHVAEDGFSVVHSHPKKLNGTKFFTWGMKEQGMFQEDFMSASDYENPKCTAPYYDPWCDAYEHVGRYTELQVGPARTQMHTFPVAANSTFEWTEWFKASDSMNGTRLFSSRYADSTDEVDSWLASSDGMNQTTIDEIDAFMVKMADVPPQESDMLNTGMPWGGLREALTGKMLVPSGATPFSVPPVTQATRPWLDLIANGTFSPETLALTPIDFEISREWVALLQASLRAGHNTWLHQLFLGTQALEVGNAALGRQYMEASMQLQPSVHAARNLALLAPTVEAAESTWLQAWALWQKLDLSADPAAKDLGKDLVGEMAAWLMLNERWATLETLLNQLQTMGSTTKWFATKDRVLHATAALAVQQGNWQSAMEILSGNCFPTYGHVRAELIELWWQANLGAAQEKNGGPLSKIETIHLRRALGCDGDDTTNVIGSKCQRGPPNLGYAY